MSTLGSSARASATSLRDTSRGGRDAERRSALATRRRKLAARVRRIALAAIVVGLISGTAGGAFASFSAVTQSSANRVVAGDVVPPTSVAASGQAGGVVRVTWTATTTSFATGYSIYRSTTSGGPWTLAGTVGGLTTVQFDDSPGAGDWYYVVRATYQNWTSANSNQAGAVTVLAAPAGVGSAVQSDGRTLRVTWSQSASTAATGYAIYRGTSASGPWSLASSVGGRATVLYDDVPPSDGAWFYVVRATGAGGVSSQDSSASPSATSLTLDHFSFAAIPTDQNSGRSFSVTMTAQTISNATVTGFTQSATLSTNNGASISPATSGPFSAGVKTVSVSVSGSYSASQTITATALSKTGTSGAFTLHDWVFAFTKTDVTAGGTCLGGSSMTKSMAEGFGGSNPDLQLFRSGSAQLGLCSAPFTSAFTLPNSPATATLYMNNSAGSACQITAALMKNTTTAIAANTLTVPAGAALTAFPLTLTPSSTTAFAANDRVNLLLTWQSVRACNNTTLYWGGTTNRSRIALPVP